MALSYCFDATGFLYKGGTVLPQLNARTWEGTPIISTSVWLCHATSTGHSLRSLEVRLFTTQYRRKIIKFLHPLTKSGSTTRKHHFSNENTIDYSVAICHQYQQIAAGRCGLYCNRAVDALRFLCFWRNNNSTALM